MRLKCKAGKALGVWKTKFRAVRRSFSKMETLLKKRKLLSAGRLFDSHRTRCKAGENSLDQPFPIYFHRHFDRVFRRPFGKLREMLGAGGHAFSGGS